MSRRLVSLSLDTVDDLDQDCRSCVFWERDAAGHRRRCDQAAAAAQKRAWVSDTLLEWGSCGQLVYVDGACAGHLLYAPPAHVPRATAFATAPVADDAVLLMSAHVAAGHAGGGLGRMLVQGMARDITRRGVRAIEAFGRPATKAAATDPQLRCLPPSDFLHAVGFKTVRQHHETPRLRLEIRSLVSWREDVESAWERLLGTIAIPVLGNR